MIADTLDPEFSRIAPMSRPGNHAASIATVGPTARSLALTATTITTTTTTTGPSGAGTG